jgi:peroxiredoxin
MKINRRLPNLFLSVFAVLAFMSLAMLPEIGAARNDLKAMAIGAKVENFTLPDVNGKQHSLDSLKGKNGTVVIFLSKQCPVVQGYNERISKIAADYKAKGVAFVGMNSNATETLEEVKTHADKNYAFPMLIDKGNVIADKFGATVTPEVYYFNKEGVLVYRGRIDNSRNGDNITDNTLRNALDAVLDGKAVALAEAPAAGCTIKRASK